MASSQCFATERPLAYNDLRDWIAALDRAGELKRVKAEVDPILEITEITDRVSKWGARNGKGPGGPALLFENVKGYPKSSVLINQFGSERRMNMALGSESFDDVAARIRQFMDIKSPQGFLDKVKMLPMLAEMGSFFPKTVSSGPCKEVIKRDKFSLFDFPILQCWPLDGGRFITLPCVTTRDPKTGKRNVGAYRMQVYDATSTGMHWQRHKGGAEHYRERLRSGAAAGSAGELNAAIDIMRVSGGGARITEGKTVKGKMEVAVAIGTDPSLMFAAIVPAPPEVEEYMIAGFLRQKPLELVKCETVDLEVPATSEIVLEGYVNLDELKVEGPFGDHTGFYSLEDLYPVFHVQCITHRKNPIYSTTVVGKPPQEDAWMGKAVGRDFQAADEDDHSRDGGREPSAGRRLPQPDDHLDSQVLSRTSAQGDERHLVAGPGDVHQVHRRGGRRLQRERSRGGHLEGLQQHRSRTRHPVHARPRGFARPLLAAAGFRLQDGRGRHAQMADRRLYASLARRVDDVGGSEGSGDGDVEEAGD